jgi:hypothetical protein
MPDPQEADSLGEATVEGRQAAGQRLVVEGLPLGEAVQKTMADVGPDPSYGNSLRLYPHDAASLAVR